MLIDKDAKKE